MEGCDCPCFMQPEPSSAATPVARARLLGHVDYRSIGQAAGTLGLRITSLVSCVAYTLNARVRARFAGPLLLLGMIGC